MTRSFFFLMTAAAVVLLLSPSAWSASGIEVRDGDRIKIQISSRELMRLAIHGGRISEYWGDESDINIKIDKTGGSIFVRPTAAGRAKRRVSFFVRDDAGRTFNLVAEVKDIASGSIVLRPSGPTPNHHIASPSRHRAEPYIGRIKRLIKAMARQVPLADYAITRDTEKIPLWQEVSLVLAVRYRSDDMLGEIYTLTNISEEPHSLSEIEFSALDAHVQAVALADEELLPGESTNVYVVRRVGR